MGFLSGIGTGLKVGLGLVTNPVGTIAALSGHGATATGPKPPAAAPPPPRAGSSSTAP